MAISQICNPGRQLFHQLIRQCQLILYAVVLILVGNLLQTEPDQLFQIRGQIPHCLLGIHILPIRPDFLIRQRLCQLFIKVPGNNLLIYAVLQINDVSHRNPLTITTCIIPGLVEKIMKYVSLLSIMQKGMTIHVMPRKKTEKPIRGVSR